MMGNKYNNTQISIDWLLIQSLALINMFNPVNGLIKYHFTDDEMEA